MSRLIAKADEVVSRMGRAAAEMVLGTEQQQQQQNVYYHAHYYPPPQPYYHHPQPPPGPVYAHPSPPLIPQPYQQPAYQHTISPHLAQVSQQYHPPPITPQHSGTQYTPHVPTGPVPATYPPPPQQQRPPTVHANSWPNPQPTFASQHAPVAPSTPVSKHDFHARPTSIYMPSAATPPNNAPWTNSPMTDAGPVTEPESSAQPPPAYDSIKFEKPVAPALPQRRKSQSAVNALLSPEPDRPNLPPRRKHAQSVSVVPSSGSAGVEPSLAPVAAAAAKPSPLVEESTEGPSAASSHQTVPDEMLRPILPLRSSRSQSLSGHAQASAHQTIPVRSDTNPFRGPSHVTGPAGLSLSGAATGVNRLTVPTPEEFVASVKTEPVERPSTEPPTMMSSPPDSVPEVPIATKPLAAMINISKPAVTKITHPLNPVESASTSLIMPATENLIASLKTERGSSMDSMPLPYPDHREQTTQMPMSPDEDTTNIGLFMRRPVSAIYESHEVTSLQLSGGLRQRPVSAIYSPHEDHRDTKLTNSDSRTNNLHPSASIIAPLKIRKPSLPSASSNSSPSTTTIIPAQLMPNPDVRKQPSNPTLSSLPDHVFELNGEPNASSTSESNAVVHEIGTAEGTEPRPGRLRKQGTIPTEWESHGGFSLGFDLGAGKRG